MRKLIILLTLFTCNFSIADTKCFIASRNNKIVEQIGDCTSRHPPCSTFKIAISLMGYNEGILVDRNTPEIPFKKGYTDWLEAWKKPHTPAEWIKNSCLWYSRVITKKLGYKKFEEYAQKLNYGNKDVSGDPRKNNGLESAWLSGSIKISPQEQILFLEKLIDNQLPVSQHAQDKTKEILFVENLEDGWKLYGKTGAGHPRNPDYSLDESNQLGWFVGWAEKGEDQIVFAHYVEQPSEEIWASIKAKKESKEKIIKIIKQS
ncbi:MAG: class D beta-lactamase [Alphaproteobacteria bacterium]|nr:class D beta-lactamase [Alphaproteobacteria bacterium]